MNKPKVVLKNVKFHEGHDTMIGFNADVWINGVKCFSAYDSANGGCYEYCNYTYNVPETKKTKVLKLVAELEAYIKTLPDKQIEFGKDKKLHSLSYDMDLFIEDLLTEFEANKTKKKQEKLMKTAFLIGVPNADRYSYINYKKALSSFPLPYLQGRLDLIVKKHCTNGNVILNTNLKELGLTI